MSDTIDGELLDTAECSAYPNRGRCTHTRCLLRERNRLSATVAALTAENERLRAAANMAIGWIAAMLERRQYEDDHELRELQGMLAAALPSSRETTDGQ